VKNARMGKVSGSESAQKDEALRTFQTQSQERIALADARAAEADKKAEEASALSR
jgi:hypothetical protein